MSFLENIKTWWKQRKEKKSAEKKARKKMSGKEKLIDNLKVFLSAYLIAFGIRLLLIEAYQIPSQSMVPNLLVKDILMVQKLSYGTILPLVNWKLPGISTPEKNDIIVFVSPEWKSPGIGKEIVSLLTLSLINLDNTFATPKNLVKRLVAEPGDTISMSNQVLYINEEPLETEFIKESLQSRLYMLQNLGTASFDIYEETFSNKIRLIQHQHRFQGPPQYTPETFEDDSIFYAFSSMYITPLKAGFPEIYVPQEGDTIELTNINNYYKFLMKLLIERESDKVVTYNEGNLYLEGEILTEWTVADNYYFAMGDNRDSSQDCRYFGFIPEKNIFGRIMFRYFPFNRLSFNANEDSDSIDKVNFIVR